MSDTNQQVDNYAYATKELCPEIPNEHDGVYCREAELLESTLGGNMSLRGRDVDGNNNNQQTQHMGCCAAIVSQLQNPGQNRL